MTRAPLRLAALTVLTALTLAACGGKKDPASSETPAASESSQTPAPDTSTAEGTAEAVGVQLSEITSAADDIHDEASARAAAQKMQGAYKHLADHIAKLKTQESDVAAANRAAVTEAFEKAQQDLAKAAGDLYERDPKLGEIFMEEINKMPLFETGPN